MKKTSVWAALSPLGKESETPQGIFYWSARAKKEAQIDGTIGVAQDDDGTISHLKIAETWAGSKIMERCPKGKIFGYGPIPGVESLRKKWLDRMLVRHPNLKAHASMPVVTNGITHSLALAGRLLLSPGDVLVTADKSWENYEHIFTDVQGIKIVPFSLFHGLGRMNGQMHIDALIGTCREVAHHHQKVVLLLNFPHNQTGYMPSKEASEKLAHRLHELVLSMPQTSFVVVLDDAYEGYVYDAHGMKESLLPLLYKNLPNFTVVKLDGISKVMLAYGYRVGFITFFAGTLDGKELTENDSQLMQAELTTKIGGLIRGEISQVNHHGQIMADALMDELPLVERERGEVIVRLAERFEEMMRALEEGYKKYGREKLWADPCNGGFFAYLNLAPHVSARKIAERLLEEKKVGVVPSEQGLRVAFAGVPKAKIRTMIEAIFEVVYG